MVELTAISEVWKGFDLRMKRYLEDKRYNQHPGFFQAADAFLASYRIACSEVHGVGLLVSEEKVILREGHKQIDGFAQHFFGEVPY